MSCDLCLGRGVTGRKPGGLFLSPGKAQNERRASKGRVWSQAPVSLGNQVRQEGTGTAGHQSGCKGGGRAGREDRSSGGGGETRGAPQDRREGAQRALATRDTFSDRLHVLLAGSVIVSSDTRQDRA